VKQGHTAPVVAHKFFVIFLAEVVVKPGRASKLTPEVIEAVCTSVAAGLPLGMAAAKAGISVRSLHTWRKMGRDGKSKIHVALVSELKKAEAELVARNVELIQTAANRGTWQAACWLLERKFPGSFGSDRREIRQLKKELKELKKQVKDGKGDEFDEL